MKQIKISDATMKQTFEGFNLSFKEKIELSKLLDRLGVDFIELDEIKNDRIDSLQIKSIATAVAESGIAVPVALNQESVEKTWNALRCAKHPRLQVFAPASAVQIEYLFHKKPDTLLAAVESTVKACRALCPDVEFIAGDATRSESAFLTQLINTAIDAGATTVTLCDTAGTMLPEELAAFVKEQLAAAPKLADITLGIGRATDSADNSIVETDEFGFITGIAKNVGKTDSDSVNLNIYVATREHLISMINDAMMRGYSSFSHEMLLRGRTEHKDKIGTYRFAETFIGVSSLIDYYNAGMAIVEDKDLYFSLFERSNFSVMTKVTNSAPTRYTKTASVHNSLIADGCYIAGNVENSIIFPGVHIASGSSVKNSIIFSDTYIGCNTCLSSVITDKNVMIGENVSLLGIPTLPIMVEEGRKL